MAEYKDVERVKTSLRNLCGGCCYRNSSNCPDDCGAIEAIRAIDSVPREDVVPVRHGRWETDGMMMDDGEYLMTRCTACGEAYEYGYNMPFCPHCGAKMDSEDRQRRLEN